MPRRCACRDLLALLSADPRLRTLPLGTRMLWLLLAEAMLATGEARLPFAGFRRVSLLVSAPEPEIETGLETLIAEGLLVRDGDGLTCPLLAASAAPKAAVSRANGALGGRPRRGESAEAARLRRAQPGLVLPIQATRPEPGAGNPHDDDKAISPSSSAGARGSGAAEALALADEVARLAGMDPARSAWNAREVQGWLAAGASPALVRGTVADVMTRAKGAPANLRYFSAAIARATAAAPASAATGPMTPQARWAADFAAHCDRGGDPTRFPRFDGQYAAA